MFYIYRKPLIPEIIDNWEELHAKQKKFITGVNNFYCGVYFLVGLPDQTEASLKLWKSLLFGEGKIASINHGGYSKGESGTLCLIGTICKTKTF